MTPCSVYALYLTHVSVDDLCPACERAATYLTKVGSSLLLRLIDWLQSINCAKNFISQRCISRKKILHLRSSDSLQNSAQISRELRTRYKHHVKRIGRVDNASEIIIVWNSLPRRKFQREVLEQVGDEEKQLHLGERFTQTRSFTCVRKESDICLPQD